MRQQQQGSSQRKQCNLNKTNGLCLPTVPTFSIFNHFPAGAFSSPPLSGPFDWRGCNFAIEASITIGKQTGVIAVVQCVFTNTDISGWSNLAVPREIHTPTFAGEQLVALRTLVGVVLCLH